MKLARDRYRMLGGGALLVALVALTGCEVDSFMDPSKVGRWERTPATLPILERLDIIDEPRATGLEITQVRPEDLIPDVREYVIGPGDVLTVTVFELIQPGTESIQTRRVSETGVIRLPVIGAVQAAGLSPSQLEESIRETLERQGILRDAMVSALLLEARQNTFSVIGEPSDAGTNIGTYPIPKPEFRLMDALAMARGAPERTKTLQIYRQATLTDAAAGTVSQTPSAVPAPAETAPPQAPDDPAALIEQLMQGVEPAQTPAQVQPQDADRPAPPPGLEAGLQGPAGGSQWVNVDGEWVRIEQNAAPAAPARTAQGAAAPAPGTTAPGTTASSAAAATPQANLDAQLGELITQRIIEVPYEKLIAGDMRYNIIIRPGDIIRVPGATAGFVYAMGEINRPGAYVVPGENDLTLMRLFASAGGLGQLAIPDRVDLVRMVGTNQQAIVRIDVGAIFAGTEPDFYLKPNDLINVGTSFAATPLAIIRNGFRATYGFGFILDRNFADDVFGEQ